MTTDTTEPKNVREIPAEFKKGENSVSSGKFRQLKANDKAYIYERKDGDQTYWEVFVRRVLKNWQGEEYYYVPYPREASFGKWAWCYNNFDKAMKKFNELTNR